MVQNNVKRPKIEKIKNFETSIFRGFGWVFEQWCVIEYPVIFDVDSFELRKFSTCDGRN